MFVVLNSVEENRRLQLNTIYVAGAENSAVDALYKLPVGRAEHFEVLQMSGVQSKGWLHLAQSMAEELGPSLMEETSLLEKEVIDKPCVAMVGSMAKVL